MTRFILKLFLILLAAPVHLSYAQTHGPAVGNPFASDGDRSAVIIDPDSNSIKSIRESDIDLAVVNHRLFIGGSDFDVLFKSFWLRAGDEKRHQIASEVKRLPASEPSEAAAYFTNLLTEEMKNEQLRWELISQLNGFWIQVWDHDRQRLVRVSDKDPIDLNSLKHYTSQGFPFEVFRLDSKGRLRRIAEIDPSDLGGTFFDWMKKVSWEPKVFVDKKATTPEAEVSGDLILSITIPSNKIDAEKGLKGKLNPSILFPAENYFWVHVEDTIDHASPLTRTQLLQATFPSDRQVRIWNGDYKDTAIKSIGNAKELRHLIQSCFGKGRP